MNENSAKIYFERLSQYPLTQTCFAQWLSWILDNVKDNHDDYVLINFLKEDNKERLSRLEQLLIDSINVLGVSEEVFKKTFGFSDDLLISDPEKIHDILAEILCVLDLKNTGFTSIIKLPPFIKIQFEKKPNADFLANFKEKKYVVEVKTIRTENNPKPEAGKSMGDGTKPNWWNEMFRNNAVKKIEDKEQRVLKQLESAKAHYHCDRKLLYLYTRRLGPSTLMDEGDYINELEELKQKYPQIDIFACRNYFSGPIIFYPELNRS